MANSVLLAQPYKPTTVRDLIRFGNTIGTWHAVARCRRVVCHPDGSRTYIGAIPHMPRLELRIERDADGVIVRCFASEGYF
jgi:hypothetical protein